MKPRTLLNLKFKNIGMNTPFLDIFDKNMMTIFLIEQNFHSFIYSCVESLYMVIIDLDLHQNHLSDYIHLHLLSTFHIILHLELLFSIITHERYN